jgi:hypothetical protein
VVHRVGVLVLLFAAGVGCGQTACPGAIRSNQPAIFNLSCPTALTKITLSGSCSDSDAGPSNSRIDQSMNFVTVASPIAGTCHVVLTFATGFTFSADVIFVTHTATDPPGSDCTSPYTGPTQSTFTVNNPSDTCVDAGP